MTGSGMFAGRSDFLDRWVRIGVASGKVISVSFPEDGPDAPVDRDHPALTRLIAYLDEGEANGFEDVEIGLTVPTDHRRIYDTVRAIPHGANRTVASVAERTAVVASGEDGLSAVRSALADNPVPVLVPDHRVDGVTGAPDPPVRTALRELEGLG